MRIAYLTQSYPPMISGTANVVCTLAESMSARGHDVLVIAASDRNTAYRIYGPNLTIMRLKSHRNPFRVGQRFISWPSREITSALKDFSPDVVHLHDPLQTGIITLGYCKTHSIPSVITIHQIPWFVTSYLPVHHSVKELIEKALWLGYKWLLGRCQIVVAPTLTIAAYVKDAINIRVKVISNGIDLDKFIPVKLPIEEQNLLRTQYHLPENGPIILYVGRLDIDKKVHRVIEASEPVIKRTGASLLIVGDGTQRPALQKLIYSKHIDKDVRFTGYLTAKEELSKIYRLSSIFVTASEIESQGIVILEAAASGLPVVAVNSGALPEIIRNGENGFLADRDDTRAMSRYIEAILTDPVLAEKMRHATLRLIRQHDIEYTFRSYGIVYQDAQKLSV
ncbi:MAG: glycosyltransferase [Anaerolineaceae bacterium]